jgi:polygalacturonase
MTLSRRTVLGSALALNVPALAAPIAAPTDPVFPARSLGPEDLGLGSSNNTAALQAAIDRAHELGGGTVSVPKGKVVTGTLFLKSGTRLHLAEGAELVGSETLADYPRRRVRWEGKWIEGHCSLIHAEDAEDIAVTGPGKIIGAASVGGMPNATYPFRHPALIESVNCRRVLLDGVSTSYDHMWNIHPTLCDDVTIRGLTIRSSEKGRDGIDVDSCRRVLIAHCDIATGDDCISLKSGRGLEGLTLARPTTDVVITDCSFADWNWACIGIGSEMSGGIARVRIANCRFLHAKTHAIYLKGQVGRGGYVEDIDVEDVDIADCGLGAVRINFLTSGKHDENPVPGEAGIPRIANFRFRRMRLHDVPIMLEATEIDPAKPLEGLVIDDVTGTADVAMHLANVAKPRLSRIRLRPTRPSTKE